MSAANEMVYPVIRPLQSSDLDAVVEIEHASYPFPWTRGIFQDCLRVGYACFGAQMNGRLAGYSVFNWGAGEAHLLNLCVRPDLQQRGLGRLLLDHAIKQARLLDCHVMFLEVRPSNAAAARLYRRLGFEEVGERPGYYPAHDGRENAVVMRRDLLA
jgi:ribosomal-protein-alanine N-acetyltransferase